MSASTRWAVPALIALRLAVSAALLWTGFYAVSDDDFSRVVIAQGFAEHPRLDPSGTSWLPLPFWLTGLAMAMFGPSLDVARGVALVTSVLSVLLVHRAALWVGGSRLAALLSAAVTAVLPTAAYLGASFQPEVLTAGLVVLGAAAAGTRDGASATLQRRRWLGALALAAACLSRYEAWPAAFVFVVLEARDMVRSRSAGAASVEGHRGSLLALGPPLLALAAPTLWMLHGAVTHGSPVFFLQRVAAYRRALGESEPLGVAVAAYPRALLAEPELVLGGLIVLGGTYQAYRLRLERQPASLEPERARAHGRFALVLGGVLVFLIAGRVLDGAPTHHPERTLLPVWFGLAVIGAGCALRLPRVAVVLGVVATSALGLGLRLLAPPETFPSRNDERAIGELARSHVPEGARLAIDTPDFGYFAVMAAFRTPDRAVPVATRDPRAPRGADAFASADALAARLRELRAPWLVVERSHWTVALRLGEPVGVRGPFALLRVLP